MIEGIALGVVSWLSLFMSWYHLPPKVKKFTLEHPVVADLSAGILVYFFLSSISKSIIAAVGAVVSGLLINFSLFFATRIQHK